MFRIRYQSVLAIFALLAMAPTTCAGQWTFTGVDRVVAISDIHGAYGAMVRTLQQAEVINDDRAWVGGRTHLVIVGDILDRGPRSREAMDLLMRLEDEAAAAGGRVHVLIGNHEAMNLVGDLRYVAVEEYAAFAADETRAQRDRWFEAWADARPVAETTAAETAASEPETAAAEPDMAALRREFDAAFPAGFFAHRVAFGSEGKYGRWLLGKPIMIVINGTAFVHGGVSPMIAEIGLSGVNEVLHGEMVQYVEQVERLTEAGLLLPTDDFFSHPQKLQGLAAKPAADDSIATAVDDVIRLNNSALHAPDGPLWYRGNVACSALIEVDRLNAALDAVGADRVVIGHTPTQGRKVYARFDGKVIEVDTGMLNSYYEGRGNALIIAGDKLRVVNESGQRWDAPLPHPRRVGPRPGDLSDDDIEALLVGGEIIADREDAAGRRIVSVSNGKQVVDAEFVRRAARGFYPQVAAYRLDRLLGLDMVPVAVRRNVDRKDGALVFVPAGLTDEEQRRQTGQGGGAMCPLPGQWEAMLVFDALLFNEARFTTTIRYDRYSWQLVLTGHAESFTTDKGRPRHLAEASLAVGPAWRTALAALDEEQLAASLGDVLDRRRLRALRTRRDALLAAP